MPKKIVNVEVESSGLDVMSAVAKVIAAQKASGAGLQEALADLGAVVGAVQALPADLKEDKAEVLKGVMIGAMDVVTALLA